jgi:gas vesicle protein
MAKQRSGLLLGGFLVGAAVGTVAGLLSAPRAGRETRALLKKSADALPELAEDLSSNLQVQAGRLSESAVQQWDETLVRLREALGAGVDAAQAQRRVIQGRSPQDESR